MCNANLGFAAEPARSTGCTVHSVLAHYILYKYTSNSSWMFRLAFSSQGVQNISDPNTAGRTYLRRINSAARTRLSREKSNIHGLIYFFLDPTESFEVCFFRLRVRAEEIYSEKFLNVKRMMPCMYFGTPVICISLKNREFQKTIFVFQSRSKTIEEGKVAGNGAS